MIRPQDIEAYEADGAVVLRGILDDHWLELLDRGIDDNIRHPGRHFVDFTAAGTDGRCVKDYWNWPNVPEYQEFFYGSPLAEAAGQLMRAGEICFLEDQFFEKGAGAATPSPWHHDQPYYEVSGDFCISWIPLDPVSEDASLEIVAGSHRWGRLYTPPNFSAEGSASYFVNEPESTLEAVPDIEAQRNELTILRWSMQPGDVLFFGPLALHANRGNPSPNRVRRATFRWAAESARFDQGVFPWASLIEDHGLSHGERLIGEMFPLLWTRDHGLLGQERSRQLMENMADE